MGQIKGILLLFLAGLTLSTASAQHPNRVRIDSLKKNLPLQRGLKQIDYLDSISEEYWWPPLVYPDSISQWARVAYDASKLLNYAAGIANSFMHLGVAEIYRKNFRTARNYLDSAIKIFTDEGDIRGMGWSNLWLGQTLYSENKFSDGIHAILKALPLLYQVNNAEGEGKACAWLSFLYAASGKYDSSFEYCMRSLQIRQKMSDDVCVAASLANMGYLYKAAGDYEDALDYYRQGMQYSLDHGINLYAPHWSYFDEPIGTLYRLMNNPDSALIYIQRAIRTDPGNQMTRISLGETLLTKRAFDSALSIFLKPIVHLKKEDDLWDLMRIYMDAAKAYEGKNDETSALKYASAGLMLAQNAQVRPYMVQGYLQLSNINKALKRQDSAFWYLQRYVSLRDSVANDQFLWRLTVYKRQTEFQKKVQQLTILDADNKLKEVRLKGDSMIKWALAGGLFVAIFASLLIYRNLALAHKNEKLETQKTTSELKLNATELEMRALRAQMNPHFIFNCLSSINRFILKNEKQEASDYLTKFSRLIRMVLTSSTVSLISIEDEVEMLRLYINMEKLRFDNAFEYHIEMSEEIDTTGTFVPPLLLQPLVENAIWHGLMHKSGERKLHITIYKAGTTIIYSIADNGIGRSNATIIESGEGENKGVGMGMHITKERLGLFNKDANEQNWFTIEDINDDKDHTTGTVVTLKLYPNNAVQPQLTTIQ